jgi:glutamate racemase
MIGFFDSGLGGLTILAAVKKRLPDLDTRYLADSEHAPYGNKSREEILELTWAGCEKLFEEGCKLVIIACNTASANALREIQRKRLQKYPGRNVLGIIRPTVEAMAKLGYRNIVVLGTAATTASGAYAAEFAHLNPDIRIHSHACPNWVGFVETHRTESAEAEADVKREMAAVEDEAPDADAILLGCTHFPYLKKQIADALSRALPIYEQGNFVAESLAGYLERHKSLYT